MANDVEIIGLEELGKSMDLLSQKVQRKTVRNAVNAGAKVYRDGMKTRAPKDTGELQNAMTIKASPDRREGGFTALVGVKYSRKVAASSRKPGHAPSSEDPGVYARFLEFGRPGAKGHTHQAAQPFIRPTFDQDTQKAEQAVGERFESEIIKGLNE